MAGIAIVLDLLRKNPNFYSSQFSASAAVSAAAVSVAAAGTPFASSYSGIQVTYCDAGAVLSDDYISNIRKASGDIFRHDSLKYSTKEYYFEGMPTILYIFRVSRTTFRGHFLGVAAAWIVQVGIEIYRFFNHLVKSEEENNKVDKSEQVIILRKKVTGVTLSCSASLVFASIGAGIGATLIRPSTGQWIGCAAGDLAGPIVVSLCLEKVFHAEL
ncbi:hypothetical protein P3X46_027305 [Hevea brasiliensis]|uniref:Uncharacterized protein n=1 Tax=Hevea brasiliensis TaxID=3981 RepID=A0ABQ9KZE5_HEVBR|nr:hypothetical protein P3X46_027305 [Hevea brasiliensis]